MNRRPLIFAAALLFLAALCPAQTTPRGKVGENLSYLKNFSGRVCIDAMKQAEVPVVTPDGLKVVVFIGPLKGDLSYDGRYTLVSDEAADVKITGGSPAKVVAPGVIEVKVANPDGTPRPTVTPQLHLLFPGRTTLPKGISVIRPNYTAEQAASQVFTSEYLALVRKVSPGVIRAMDWQRTNGSLVTTWDSRCKVTDTNWGLTGRGGPLEPLIALCNATGSDLWLNVPHLADDGWCYNAAVLCRDGLDPKLRLWLEYSNEDWNTFASMAAQTAYAKKRGNELFAAGDKRVDGANETVRGRQFHAIRTAETGGIVRTVFAAKGQQDRVCVVLAGQAGWPDQLQWSIDVLNKHFGGVAANVGALAATGYWGASDYVIYQPDGPLDVEYFFRQGYVIRDATARDGRGVPTAWGPQRTEPGIYLADKSVSGPRGAAMQAFFKQGRDNHVPCVAYERGFGLSNGIGGKLAGLARPLTLDPRLEQYEKANLDESAAQGMDVQNQFVLLSPNEDSTYALTEEVALTDTPRIRAVAAFNAAKPHPFVEVKPDPAAAVIAKLQADLNAAVAAGAAAKAEAAEKEQRINSAKAGVEAARQALGN